MCGAKSIVIIMGKRIWKGGDILEFILISCTGHRDECVVTCGLRVR